MKKILCLVLALAMVLGLAGCCYYDFSNKTVGDLMLWQGDFPSDYENGWVKSNDSDCKIYYVNNQLMIKNGSNNADTLALKSNKLTSVYNGCKIEYRTQTGCVSTITFVMDDAKITSIVISGYNNPYAGTYTASAPVPDVSVTSVSLNPKTLQLQVGNTSTLEATVLPNNATNKNVSWESNDTGVATVDSTGVVSAIAAGTAVITVTTEDGNKTDTCTVNVTTPTLTIGDILATVDGDFPTEESSSNWTNGNDFKACILYDN